MPSIDPEDESMNDIAVLHGNYFARGGGERVADAIARHFDAPLFYGYGNDDAVPDDDIERRKLFDPTILGNWLAGKIHQYRDFRFMWNGMHVPELLEYDVVIQSGNEFGWYVPKDDQAVVKYVHSPPRGPYDMFHENGKRRGHRAYCLAVKTLYRHTVSYPDVYIANSELVAHRCRKYWGEGVNPRVVYPPVDTDKFGRENCVNARPATYLAISRLFRHKRIREIMDAFDGRDSRLIVAGDGPQREELEQRAAANVDVRGYVSEAEKRRLYAECVATIFNAKNEDAGLVPVEAMASGRPVIGVDDGFTSYQIRDGVNGVLIDESATADAVAAAIDRFEREGVSMDARALESFAESFSCEQFTDGLEQAVADAVDRQDLSPKCWQETPAVVE